MVFIQGTRFTRAGGTNRKGAAGSGQFRVGKQVWRGEVLETRVRAWSGYCVLGACLVFLLVCVKEVSRIC